MDYEERTAFTSLLAQLDSMNKRIKDLEEQLDNYFIVSQKYYKSLKVLREIKQICEKNIHTFSDGTVLRYTLADKILEKCEVLDDMEND